MEECCAPCCALCSMTTGKLYETMPFLFHLAVDVGKLTPSAAFAAASGETKCDPPAPAPAAAGAVEGTAAVLVAAAVAAAGALLLIILFGEIH